MKMFNSFIDFFVMTMSLIEALVSFKSGNHPAAFGWGIAFLGYLRIIIYEVWGVRMGIDTSNDIKNLFWALIFIVVIVAFGLLIMDWVL